MHTLLIKTVFFPPPLLLLLGAPATMMRLSTKPETITGHRVVYLPGNAPLLSPLILKFTLYHHFCHTLITFTAVPLTAYLGEGRPSRVIGSKSLQHESKNIKVWSYSGRQNNTDVFLFSPVSSTLHVLRFLIFSPPFCLIAFCPSLSTE